MISQYVNTIIYEQTGQTEPIVTAFNNEKSQQKFAKYVSACEDRRLVCCDRVPVYTTFLNKEDEIKHD